MKCLTRWQSIIGRLALGAKVTPHPIESMDKQDDYRRLDSFKFAIHAYPVKAQARTALR